MSNQDSRPNSSQDSLNALAAFLLRMAPALLFLVAGLNKFLGPGGPSGTMSGMATAFAETWLPLILVKPFAFALPFIEVALGLFLMTGLYRNAALVGAGLLLLVLLFGKLVLGAYDDAPMFFIYLMTVSAALIAGDRDRLTIERIFQR